MAASKKNKGTKCTSVKGKPKSGRIWKREGKRKSDIINVKSLHKSWTTRKKERLEKDSIRAHENALKTAILLEKQKKRERTLENQKRREENIKKSEIVQKITDSSKIKRMKKKELRKIETR
ncbi:coiled-coil domain-containing protein 86 isoform X1 [Hydra vulgaris]|uniref:Coiled-coil domain-containing protein 86 n=1 Tax=Hydra vulgaris TaxID=6087 RepID=T2M5Z7_HYDVU|nr:coiled-coil domain-containing protein 86 [Hydra vulgaris]